MTPDPDPIPLENDPPDEVHQTDDVAALRTEAANRRRALRAAEAERDGLLERLDERDREDVQRLVAERLADPGDLWLSTSLDVMRDDKGRIDVSRAEAEVDRVLAEKPHWAKVERQPLPSQPQGAREPDPPAPSFGQSVKKALRGG